MDSLVGRKCVYEEKGSFATGGETKGRQKGILP